MLFLLLKIKIFNRTIPMYHSKQAKEKLTGGYGQLTVLGLLFS
jgi:hypothetical protein